MRLPLQHKQRSELLYVLLYHCLFYLYLFWFMGMCSVGLFSFTDIKTVKQSSR